MGQNYLYLPDKQGFCFPALAVFGNPPAVPDHLKRHLLQGVFLFIYPIGVVGLDGSI